MAAHMQRVLRVSGVFEKSRIPRKEYALSVCLKSNYLSTGPDNSSSPAETSQNSAKEPEAVPNHTNVTPVGFNVAGHTRGSNKFPSLINASSEDEQSKTSFAKLFRDSNFVHLGNPSGKVVFGTIYRIVGDDMYIDFDWKFPCVVKKPTEDAHLYVNNARVSLKIINLEMSTIFLGAEKETSVNEANCVLVSLVSSPLGTPRETANVL